MKKFTGVLAVLITLSALQISGCMKNNTMEPYATDQDGQLWHVWDIKQPYWPA